MPLRHPVLLLGQELGAGALDVVLDRTRLAGFSMVSIKRALLQVGIMDDRNDIQSVARTLECPRGQATRVLEELERSGLVTKTSKKKQWETTPKGHKLAFYWHPPRKFTPAIDRESDRGDINEGFAAVPCGIWRSSDDQEEMFEEAELNVSANSDYEGERLDEISVLQPDEYQGENAGSSTEALAVYLSPGDAREFANGVLKAVERAEAEVARRRAQKARKGKRAEAKGRMVEANKEQPPPDGSADEP